MRMLHGDQGGQLQSRCTQMHKPMHQHRMRCIHAYHMHARTDLRTSHMSAGAAHCTYSRMNIRIRLVFLKEKSKSICELDSLIVPRFTCMFANWSHKECFLPFWSAFYELDVHVKWRPVCRADQVWTRGRPGANQVHITVYTKQRPGRFSAWSLMGLQRDLHLVYTWSTLGPQLGLPRKLLIIATITITICDRHHHQNQSSHAFMHWIILMCLNLQIMFMMFCCQHRPNHAQGDGGGLHFGTMQI